jgi:hypothetical protein
MKENILFKIFIIAILLGSTLFSCSQEAEKEKNNLVIDREIMIQIMAEAHASEATVEIAKIESIEQIIQHKKSYFNSILKHYNTTDSIFNLSFDYYSSNLADFSKMYDEVIELLAEKEAKYNELIIAQKDSINNFRENEIQK